MTPKRIVTEFVNPTIPIRSQDWVAHYDDPEGCTGSGPTQAAAIADLIDNDDRGPGEVFWVVEHFERGKSGGYWDGGSSRSFTPNIDAAIQFHRQQDAKNLIVGWHWADVQITSHMMLPSP